MGTTLAVLMVLGIFVGIPAVIGFSIAGVYILSDRRARKAERAKAWAALAEATAEAQREQPAPVRGKAVARKPSRDRTLVK